MASTGKASKGLVGLIGVALAAGLGWWISSGDAGDGADVVITPPLTATTGVASTAPSQTEPAPTVGDTAPPTEVPTTPPATDEATSTSTTSTSTTVAGRTGTDPESGLRWIALTALPPEALDTLDLISQGAPFPYDRDGATFQNREGILPDRPNGYYREYTVETPGSDDRGARRIVTGEGGDEYFYTEDHYDSFERIDW